MKQYRVTGRAAGVAGMVYVEKVFMARDGRSAINKAKRYFGVTFRHETVCEEGN